MIREEFIKVLDDKGYSYEIEGNKIVVTHGRYVDLESLTSIPHGVEFKNGGYVDLKSLTSLSPGVSFRNEGSVDLKSLTSLPPGVEFKNIGDVYLKSLTGGRFYDWKGNIKGIDKKRLMNKMIKDGLFER
jgi:hypothetical protein